MTNKEISDVLRTIRDDLYHDRTWEGLTILQVLDRAIRKLDSPDERIKEEDL